METTPPLAAPHCGLDLHETVLYRALQEALANIARHALATHLGRNCISLPEVASC